MLRWLKYAALPILFYLYLQFVNFVVGNVGVVAGSITGTSRTFGGETIGYGEVVSVSVTRSYLFGLLRLPVYVAGLGSIAFLHETFFNIFFIIIAAFVAFDLFKFFRGTSYKSFDKIPSKFGKMPGKVFAIHRYQFEKRGGRLTTDVLWKRIAKAVAIGLLIGFLALIFSGDAANFGAFAVLAAYLEFRWHK